MPSVCDDIIDAEVNGEPPPGDFQKFTDEQAEAVERKLLKRKQRLYQLIAKSDSKALREEALQHGLIDDDVRSKAWPLLLDLKDLPDWDNISGEELESHHEYNQVVLDVNRSIKRFPPSIEDSRRIAIQDELIATIVTILSRNPGLHYYQGFHDVAVTILLVVKSKMAGHIIEKISTEHLKPFLEPTMERTSSLLEYIYPILEKIDLDLCKHLDRSGVGTIFCLPWFITWFSHTIEVYETLMRLFDYFLAYDHKPGTEFLLPLYLIVSILEHWKDDILEQECEMAALHSFFYRPLDTLDFEMLLKKADRYYHSYPPESMKKAVEKRIKDKEERQRLEDLERKALRERRLRPKAPNTPWMRRLTVVAIGVVFVLSSVYYARVKSGNYRFSMAQISNILRNHSYLWTYLHNELEET
nr:PREDICTED: TBC1 domain family member 20 isoform X2 [Bemisia tabaci]